LDEAAASDFPSQRASLFRRAATIEGAVDA
jgi:hypothetical protein